MIKKQLVHIGTFAQPIGLKGEVKIYEGRTPFSFVGNYVIYGYIIMIYMYLIYLNITYVPNISKYEK